MNYQEVEAHYDAMMQLWTDADSDVTINQVNRALSNWHAVGVYLSQQEREAQAALMEAEINYETAKAQAYENALTALRAGGGKPTVKEIESYVLIHGGEVYSAEQTAYNSARLDRESVMQLRRVHDKSAGVLQTLSSNMRTDFMYADSNSPVGRAVEGGQAQNRANNLSMGEAEQIMGGTQ